MSKQREYLVDVSVWSANHVWVKAVSEDEACQKAEDLWTNDETENFISKSGAIDSVAVLESREVRS